MCFFGPTLERKKGERRENLTLATATIRTVWFCLEPRAEIRACITCPDAFIVNWESSFFLDHAAHTAGREVEQTSGPRSQGAPRREKAHESSSWEILKMHSCSDAAAVANYRRNRKDPPVSWAITCDLLSPTTSVRHAEIHQRTHNFWMQTVWPHLCTHPGTASAHSSKYQHLLLLINFCRYIDCISWKRAMPSLEWYCKYFYLHSFLKQVRDFK